MQPDTSQDYGLEEAPAAKGEPLAAGVASIVLADVFNTTVPDAGVIAHIDALIPPLGNAQVVHRSPSFFSERPIWRPACDALGACR